MATALAGFADQAGINFVIKRLGCATLPDFLIQLIAQIGHAFTFGSNHAVTMSYLHRHFGQTHQTKGQALYIVLAFGVGGSVGGLASGLLWDAIGGAGMFMLASLASLIALIATWRGIADDSKLITDQ